MKIKYLKFLLAAIIISSPFSNELHAYPLPSSQGAINLIKNASQGFLFGYALSLTIGLFSSKKKFNESAEQNSVNKEQDDPFENCSYYEINLFDAIKYNQPAVVAFHIQRGTNLNVKNKNGYTPLMYAAYYNNQEIAKQLIDAGVELDCLSVYQESAAFIALKENSHCIWNLLVDAGVNVKIQNGKGATMLMVAASNGDNEIVRKLIKNGVDINLQDIHGYTPLMCAIACGKNEAAEILINSGADIHLMNARGYKAIEMAALYHNESIVEFLLDEDVIKSDEEDAQELAQNG